MIIIACHLPSQYHLGSMIQSDLFITVSNISLQF